MTDTDLIRLAVEDLMALRTTPSKSRDRAREIM